MNMHYTTEIASPPEALWRWIEEPEKQQQWMKGLRSNEPTSDGPTRVGSTFHMEVKEGSKVVGYDGRIVAYEPPRHLGVAFGGPTMKNVEVRADYQLEDLGDGRTRLHYASAADASQAGALMRVFMPLFALFGKAQLRGFMRTLKRLAEAEAQPDGAPVHS